jgi:phosphatidylinositol alpha-1,6-mannosyltransferase
VRHLLVTNDFPPKLGGIQSYLWELWRRLPSDDVTVLTTSWPGAREWDAAQPFRVERARERVLLPTRALARHVRTLAAEVGAGLVVLDPALPLGLVGPTLGLRYAVVVHGAEVSLPGRLPGARRLLARVLRQSAGIVAAGRYPADQAARVMGEGRGVHPLVAIVPPSVDVDRFRVLDAEQRSAARASLGLPVDGRLVVSVSRLVPRKGMDVLIDAAARLGADRPDVTVAIAGDGRDRGRLERRIRSLRAPVRLLGRLPGAQLPELYGCADVFAMLCRDRWGGLEQEGFGIVFLEAAACGVPQVAGHSGGAEDAVVDGETGIVVRRPNDPRAAATALARLLDDAELRRTLGTAARRRVEADFSHDGQALQLAEALAAVSAS